MIFGIVIFAIISVIFSVPRLQQMVAGEQELSPREEKIGILFGHYMGAAAVLLFFLHMFRSLYFPYFYIGAGGLCMILTFGFLYKTVRILKKEEN